MKKRGFDLLGDNGPLGPYYVLKKSGMNKFWPSLLPYVAPHEKLQKEINQAIVIVRMCSILGIILLPILIVVNRF